MPENTALDWLAGARQRLAQALLNSLASNRNRNRNQGDQMMTRERSKLRRERRETHSTGGRVRTGLCAALLLLATLGCGGSSEQQGDAIVRADASSVDSALLDAREDTQQPLEDQPGRPDDIAGSDIFGTEDLVGPPADLTTDSGPQPDSSTADGETRRTFRRRTAR